jgi:integrase/recombinase XerC
MTPDPETATTPTDLIPAEPPPADGVLVAAALHADAPWPRTLRALTADRSPGTIRAYAADLRALVAHVCTVVPGALPPDSGPSDALEWLCTGGRHDAVERALGWVAAMQTQGLSQATIARRVAALRVCVDVARQLGVLDWRLDIRLSSPQPYRDTRGPGINGVQRLLAAAAAQPAPQRERDLAIIWLLFGRALRRAEIVGLDLDDLDLEHHRIQILGKHRRDREWVTVPPQTSAAVAAWLAVRGGHPGPLLWSLDRASFGQRLTAHGVGYIVHHLGALAGLPAHQARPHGLRHAAITAGLDRTGGDTRAVQAFARLRDANTIRHYDDSRADLGGTVAGQVADGI